MSNPPEFSSIIYNETVMENRVGVIANVSAVDRDGGHIYGHVNYSVLHEPDIPCAINELGEITNLEPLDAEGSLDVIKLYVEARDGGGLRSIAEVRITVLDENDHKPRFTSEVYHLSVPEDAAMDEEVVTLSAVDHDVSEEYHTIKTTTRSWRPPTYSFHSLSIVWEL